MVMPPLKTNHLSRHRYRWYCEDDNGDGTIDDYMVAQSHTAIHEADMIVFVVDTSCKASQVDETIAKQSRTLGKPVLLVAK